MAAARASAAESQAFQINTDQWPEYDGYTQLGEEEIRVIDIEAGNPPVCRMRHVSLEEKPHYQGLSYYWGAPVEPEISKQLNLMDREATVWLDVLCINQRDPEERSRQVSLMGNIFTFAARVYVWLGEGDADSDYAFDYIDNNARTYNHQILSLCFEQLTLRPYWTRLWVIQEIALARSVLILCGTKLSSWDDFSHSIERTIAERAPHFRQVMNVRNHGYRARQLFQLMENFKDAVIRRFPAPGCRFHPQTRLARCKTRSGRRHH
ncbi:uncharacterized protein Z518_05759 [Rhinocladiella mackenziei CBS 650.93]|uniref:Heterokaryon incompatibility domain-containing protein n=1 Tax=Rhinocladiella mackenziei CBS 650.93 TaxID=1442369 RepID=A0A0D2H384_9EURO|nr:uncharacterized protein Z518_05759 [Rhinocladiella mackenziei CBS 650.93]KIX04888.1 hypothetical protein Z518_05759 [Rhinocladiella mackenziei CBS 650.93]